MIGSVPQWFGPAVAALLIVGGSLFGVFVARTLDSIDGRITVIDERQRDDHALLSKMDGKLSAAVQRIENIECYLSRGEGCRLPAPATGEPPDGGHGVLPAGRGRPGPGLPATFFLGGETCTG